jgi:DNA polymerase-3 subunit beta
MNDHGTRTLQCELPVSAIKACLLFAGKDDIRGYLNGMCVEHTPKGIQLIACDGHRLIVYNVEGAEPAEVSTRFVISRAVLASALKLVPKGNVAISCVWSQTRSADPTRQGVTVIGASSINVGGVVTADVQDALGKFPEWERIVPQTVSGEVSQFNVLYLADAAKAAALLKGGCGVAGYISVGHNGTSAALVNLSSDAFAAIMPMRGDAQADIKLPDWYTLPAPKVKKAA